MSKTRKKNKTVILDLITSIKRESSDFSSLYLNREEGLLYSKEINCIDPQYYIRNILVDINKKLIKANNFLVKRKKDNEFGKKDEWDTRAAREFRGREKKSFNQLNITKKNQLQDLDKYSSITELKNLEKDNTNINHEELYKFVRIQIVNILNLVIILTGSRKDLYNYNLEQLESAPAYKYEWAKVNKTHRIPKKVKEEITKLILKTSFGTFFKLNHKPSNGEYKAFESASKKDKVLLEKWNKVKNNELDKRWACREWLFCKKKKPSFEKCQREFEKFRNKIIDLLPTVNKYEILHNLEEKDSLKSLAYFRQHIQKPDKKPRVAGISRTPSSSSSSSSPSPVVETPIHEMWDTNKLDKYNPRLWTALYVYRMKYIFKMEMKEGGSVITNPVKRAKKLKRFIHIDNLIINNSPSVGSVSSDSMDVGLLAHNNNDPGS